MTLYRAHLIVSFAALFLLALILAGCETDPQIIEVEVPVEVEKVVEVEVVKEVQVPVEVEKVVVKEVPVEVEKVVVKEVPVEVEKVVVKEVPVEVEKVVEVEKIVEVVVVKEAPTPVPTVAPVHTSTPAPTAPPVPGSAGGRIAFSSESSIYVMNADGAGVTRLTADSTTDGSPSWSPDGSHIAFSSHRDGNRDIYVMNADGSDVTRLTDDPAYEDRPSWSPDGRRIIFYSDRDGNPEIYVMNADGSGQTRLTHSPSGILGANWLPDGRIGFNEEGGIYVMNADGSGRTKLLDDGEWYANPSWSPDGQRIAVMLNGGGYWDTYVMNADGSGRTLLASASGFGVDPNPNWSPDGRRIVFVSGRDGNPEIYVMNADGSGQTRLTANDGFDESPNWSPVGNGAPAVAAAVISPPTPTPAPTAMPVPTATPLPAIDVRESKSITADGEGRISGSSPVFGGFTCALREDGEAVCWGGYGYFSSNQFDLGEDWDSTKAARPPGGRFTAIDAGARHTCALSETGNAVCWGHPDSGRTNAPGNRFVAISAGRYHTCALSEDGDAACWGYDARGRTQVPNGRYKAISAGASHTCALSETGNAVCWGSNDDNQATDVLGEGFVMISAGGSHNCALRADGTGACWGGSEGSAVVPLEGPFKTISAGYGHTCALYEDGSATCWGAGNDGQSSPPRGRFSEIAAGRTHSCALRESGEVVCWGSNIAGESSPPGGLFGRSVRTSDTWSDPDALPAAILARFSTADPIQGESRAGAVSEILAQYKSSNTDTGRVLDLLHIIAPELSIEERRRAADELARLSEDGDWSDADTFDATQHLAAVITGEEVNAQGRIAAANRMVELYETGDLDADTALNLMDTIAPGLAINQRRQAAESLARLSADDDWNHDDRMAAASEVFRLVTGVPLNAEGRIGATVDLAGVSVKIFGGDQFDDRDVDTATSVIKQAISGDLTPESLAGILGFGN